MSDAAQQRRSLLWSEDAAMSRRNFLKGAGGALIIGFVAGPLELAAQGPNPLVGAGSNRLDAWIAVGADGMITAYTGKCELGTGLFTAQTQLVAEEVSVPFNRVKLIASDTEIRQAMENVYCRCNTASRMMSAIKKYAEKGVRA